MAKSAPSVINLSPTTGRNFCIPDITSRPNGSSLRTLSSSAKSEWYVTFPSFPNHCPSTSNCSIKFPTLTSGSCLERRGETWLLQGIRVRSQPKLRDRETIWFRASLYGFHGWLQPYWHKYVSLLNHHSSPFPVPHSQPQSPDCNTYGCS